MSKSDPKGEARESPKKARIEAAELWGQIWDEQIMLGLFAAMKHSIVTWIPPMDRPHRRLPHGPHGIAPARVKAHQRTRLITSCAQQLHEGAELGDISIPTVLEMAKVSRTTLYELFYCKWDLLLSTYRIALARRMTYASEKIA